MVVVEEVVLAAVDACPVAFVDHPLLACRRMPPPVGRVDGAALDVVDEGPEERFGGDAFDEAPLD